MRKGSQNIAFYLTKGVKVVIPEGATKHMKVPRSAAKFGDTLPLVAFLQEAKQEEDVRKYQFATWNTSGRGLKCFVPAEVEDGDEVEIVMVHSNGVGRLSAAMHFSDQAKDFITKYQRDQFDLRQCPTEQSPTSRGGVVT